MDVILLERIAKLGQMGDVVRVKNGFARNFLLPAGKALRATADNQKVFEHRRSDLEARDLELRKEAASVGENLAGREFIVIRSASSTGVLYGSVTARDIWESALENGVSLNRPQIMLTRPIKELGMHEVSVALHPEVEVAVTINVARSEDEARLQPRGESEPAVEDESDNGQPESREAAPDAESANVAAPEAGRDSAESPAEARPPAEHSA